LVCIFSQSWCEFSCDDCHQVQAGLLSFLASNKGINRQVQESTDDVCKSFPLFKTNCSEEFPKFWEQIATFENEHYNANSNNKDECQVICKNKKAEELISSKIFGNSSTCEEKAATAFQDISRSFEERQISQVADSMQEQGFCRKHYPQQTGQCAEGIKVSLSIIINAISSYPDLASSVCQAPARPNNRIFWFFPAIVIIVKTAIVKGAAIAKVAAVAAKAAAAKAAEIAAVKAVLAKLKTAEAKYLWLKAHPKKAALLSGYVIGDYAYEKRTIE